MRLLDWEAARRGPAAWDLAHALSPTTTQWDAATACALTPAETRALLEAYVAAGGAPNAVAQVGVLLGAVVFRALAWCLGFRADVAGGRSEASASLADALERLTGPAAVRDAVAFVDDAG